MRRPQEWFTLAALGATLIAVPGAQAQVEPRPKEVTDSAVARGRKVFSGSANCVYCHGPDARGTDHGPDLADTLWIQGKGTWAEIIDRVNHGISRRESSMGQAMPMRGWTPLGANDVIAVAAYVWSLSRPK